jgi:hypothetical protein
MYWFKYSPKSVFTGDQQDMSLLFKQIQCSTESVTAMINNVQEASKTILSNHANMVHHIAEQTHTNT